jgi:hypothetical protein
MEVPEVVADASTAPGARGKERRRSNRYPCSGFAEVMVVQPECLFRGEIRDISQHGCFIISRAPLRLVRLCDAEIRFKLNDHQFRIRARVMSARQGDGVGFEFHDVNPQSEALLGNLIRELSQIQG